MLSIKEKAGMVGIRKLLEYVCVLLCTLLIPFSAAAELKIHVIDVGQGDAILVQCDGQSMLVDAGPEAAGSVVSRYLKETVGLSGLDIVVATHEHDDHLFGMPDALSGLSVKKVYSPASVPMSYWFTTILPRLKQKELEVVKPLPQESFQLGDAAVSFLNVLTEAGNANDLSLVLRIDYGGSSALLTADIEGNAETAMVQAGIPLKADLLKVAHHGGNTSTCESFLNAVSPQYAVISVGAGNKHGHPHRETLSSLANRNVTVYRTDLFGTVVCISDGEGWTFEVSKAR